MSETRPERRLSRWRWFALAALLIAIGGAGGFAIRAGLKTCGALDIFFGRSSCRASVTLEGFQPMLFETIAVSSKSGRVLLFGDALTSDGWRAGWAEIGLDPLTEKRRGPLPMITAKPNTMRISPDGSRVVIRCDVPSPCVEGGGVALDAPVDALAEARPAEGVETQRYRREPPGVPDIAWKAPYRSVVLPDMATLAGVEGPGSLGEKKDELVLRRLADGVEIRRIAIEPAARISPFDRALAASRSGRLVVLVTASNPPRVGSLARVFDVAAGRQIGTIATDPGFNAKATGAFTQDETGVILVRRVDRTATEVAVFDLPGKVVPK